MTIPKAKYGKKIGRTHIAYSSLSISIFMEAWKRGEGKAYKE